MSIRVSNSKIFVRSLSEGMYVFKDPELQRGKNHSLIAVAPDRAHPYFEQFVDTFEGIEKELMDLHHVKLFLEDHPGGYLHEKFECKPQEFHCYLIHREGNLILERDVPFSEQDVMQGLFGRSSTLSVNIAPM